MTTTVDAGLTITRGSLMIPTGLEAVRQRAEQFLRLRRGESFIFPGRGIRYYEEAFNRSPELAVQVISDGLVTNIAEITRVVVVNLDIGDRTRRTSVTLGCSTTFGDFELEAGL